jgi:membrane protein YqaA with SNARE-associated domain
MKWMRQLYNWVLSWAERPGGERMLFGISLAESSFFPIPPDVLLVALGLGAPKRVFRFAFITGVGSVIGGVLGYLIGALFMDSLGAPILDFYGAQGRFEQVRELFAQYDAWVIAIAGFTPIPYKVFTIAAGAFSIDPLVFILASTGSRFARFYIVAGVIRMMGERAREFIDNHLERLVVLFTILLVGGFALIKFLL